MKTGIQKRGWYTYEYKFMWTLFFYNVNKILWMMFHMLIINILQFKI